MLKFKIYMKTIMQFISSLLGIVNTLSNKYKNKVDNVLKEPLNILSLTYDEGGRFLEYTISNNKLLAHKDILEAIYNTLMSNERFTKFGESKIIIISA